MASVESPRLCNMLCKLNAKMQRDAHDKMIEVFVGGHILRERQMLHGWGRRNPA